MSTLREEGGGGAVSIKCGAGMSPESVKVIAESQGVSSMSDDARQFLADDVTYRLKRVLENSMKVMRHSKRSRLTTSDFDQALSMLNVQPLYGFHSVEDVPFRQATGGGREVYFTEDKEIDLQELISSQMPKVPLDVAVRAHWLAIEGQQPAVPENPSSLSKDILKLESIDPTVKAAINKPNKLATAAGGKPAAAAAATAAGAPAAAAAAPGKAAAAAEKVKLKDLTPHELSAEQQLYYKEMTEACVGSDETRRHEALHSLASDPGMHQMLPRFSTFIAEGVRVNVVQNNLALLIYLMRMCKSLIENSTLYLEKYLHEIIPALLSCIVSKQLCLRPDVDNHWALRDFASRLLKDLCKSFSTSTNNVQVRITGTLTKALRSDTAPLATQYGAIVALGELGPDVVRLFVVPYVATIAARLQFVSERAAGVTGGSMTDRTAAEHVKQALLKIVPPALKSFRSAPDILEEYKAEFSLYLGPLIHSAVLKLRAAVSPAPSGSTAGITAGSSISLLSMGAPAPAGSTSNIFRGFTVQTRPSAPSHTLLMSTPAPGSPSPFKQPITTQQVRLGGASLTPQPMGGGGAGLTVGMMPGGVSSGQKVQFVVQPQMRIVTQNISSSPLSSSALSSSALSSSALSSSALFTPSGTSAPPARIRLIAATPGTTTTAGQKVVIATTDLSRTGNMTEFERSNQ